MIGRTLCRGPLPVPCTAELRSIRSRRRATAPARRCALRFKQPTPRAYGPSPSKQPVSLLTGFVRESRSRRSGQAVLRVDLCSVQRRGFEACSVPSNGLQGERHTTHPFRLPRTRRSPARSSGLPRATSVGSFVGNQAAWGHLGHRHSEARRPPSAVPSWRPCRSGPSDRQRVQSPAGHKIPFPPFDECNCIYHWMRSEITGHRFRHRVFG
jgi:hypothetical protein